MWYQQWKNFKDNNPVVNGKFVGMVYYRTRNSMVMYAYSQYKQYGKAWYMVWYRNGMVSCGVVWYGIEWYMVSYRVVYWHGMVR